MDWLIKYFRKNDKPISSLVTSYFKSLFTTVLKEKKYEKRDHFLTFELRH